MLTMLAVFAGGFVVGGVVSLFLIWVLFVFYTSDLVDENHEYH